MLRSTRYTGKFMPVDATSAAIVAAHVAENDAFVLAAIVED